MRFSCTVLGCSATFPSPVNPCSGYLIQTPNIAIWVDCGSGTFAALQHHVRPHDLNALWVSHLHPDHSADLLTAFNWAINTSDPQPLPVYGPPGWADRLAAMLPSDGASDLVHQAFEVHELHDGHTASVDDIQLYSLAVEHSVPAYGLRAEYHGHAIAYSGDTGPCSALVELGRNADLLVCEAGAAYPQRAHCTPYEAGQAAARARSHRLMLTHLAHACDESQAVAEASRAAGCPVEIARAGHGLEV